MLRFLNSVRGIKHSGYGNIASKAEIKSADKARKICNELGKFGLSDIEEDRVQSTELAEQWLKTYDDILNEQIREYVYDDYEFALLCYLYHQEILLSRNDMPKLLEDVAPRIITGCASMNPITNA